jgi:hypothetical protein
VNPTRCLWWLIDAWNEIDRKEVINAVCDAVEGWINAYYFSDDLDATIDRL